MEKSWNFKWEKVYEPCNPLSSNVQQFYSIQHQMILPVKRRVFHFN
jgi:hypothetical protein